MSFKVSASKITTLDAELFVIRLEVFKTTSMNIEHIILITSSLCFARKVVDHSVYFEQAHSLAVYSALKSFFVVTLAIKSNSGIV